jgi:ABC-type antimicrobial peptide transport system permease subunit
MGKAGHIGSVVSVWGGNYTITGITKNFVYNDMYAPSEPVMLFCQPENTGVLSLRFKSGVEISKALAQAEAIVKTANPGYPFEYKFVDDEFGRLFKTETLIEGLAGVFAMLAIFISCLGLFGLSAYMAERRIKEIGIRKTLGAGITGITALLSKDFLKLVFIATIIAFPLAWWYMYTWLQNYAYHVDINWGVFIAAGAAAMFIAVVTISFQTIKAAVMNPVKSLRSE